MHLVSFPPFRQGILLYAHRSVEKLPHLLYMSSVIMCTMRQNQALHRLNQEQTTDYFRKIIQLLLGVKRYRKGTCVYKI